MDEWKPEYARSITLGLYSAANKDKDREVFHHVHPYVSGRAHCRANIRLDMSDVRSEPPEAEHYCANCGAKRAAFKQVSSPQ